MGVLDRFWRGRGGARKAAPGRPGEAAELPRGDEVFLRFLDRWYSDADRARRAFRGIRPDAEVCAAPGTPAAGAAPGIDPERARSVLQMVKGLAEAAGRDWPTPSGAPALDLEWVDAFDRRWTRASVRELLERQDPAVYMNRVVVTCGELGAALGEVLLAMVPRCEWLAGSPYWESAVYDPRSGVRINVFDWAVRKLSEDAVDGSLATKVKGTAVLVESGWKMAPGSPRGGAG
jgi:hypothetical protein